MSDFQEQGLTMLDQWGGRKAIIPAPAKGRFRKWRTRIQLVLFAIFLGLPWLKINGEQALLLDIPHRRFAIFGQVFLSHDAPLIFLILFFLTLLLAVVTAVWGRVWCGWACPQTVFIDGLYRRIEEWIEGDYITRRRRLEQPTNIKSFLQATAKWFAFVAVSSIIAHSFIAYFVGADHLVNMIKGGPEENWFYFVLISAVTATLTFNFGWFREQFCIIMCPYGRIQSVLMDEKSVTVLYDATRGEPRKGLQQPGKTAGDCVACNRCVQVCPTGIDIRNGTQLECIACTACIDACDEIMAKVHRPPQLIRYQNLTGTGAQWRRPRVVAYLFLMLACLAGLGAAYFQRAPYVVTLLRATDTPYQVLPNGDVINHFKLHLLNQSSSAEVFQIQMAPVWAAKGLKITMSDANQVVSAGQDKVVHFFAVYPKSLLDSRGELTAHLEITESSSTRTEEKTLRLVGPAQL